MGSTAAMQGDERGEGERQGGAHWGGACPAGCRRGALLARRASAPLSTSNDHLIAELGAALAALGYPLPPPGLRAKHPDFGALAACLLWLCQR